MSTIENLEKRFEEIIVYQEKHMDTKWINVQDRLPEKYDNVIICENDSKKQNMYIAHLTEYDSWNIKCDCYEGSVCFPTHWMPLPDLPEVKYD